MNEQSTVQEAEVVVVGAGLSGLYAALLLQEAGHDVLVVEASSSVGGRIRTIELGGAAIDIGGTGLGPQHHRAIALTKRFNLETRPLTTRGKLALSIRGELLHDHEWQDATVNQTGPEERDVLPTRIDSYFMQTLLPFEDLDGWLAPENAQYDVSFADYLRSKNVSSEALRLINMCINTNDIETVSALSIFRDAIKWRQVGYNDPKNFDQYGDVLYQPVRTVGGMIRLPRKLAAALHRPVQLSAAANEITYSKAGVTVSCANGLRVRARRAVIAVPMVTLRRIHFSPSLPPPLAEAVANAASSGNTQFILSTTKRFWEEDGYAPSLWTDTVFERMFVEFEEDGEVDHLRVWINGDNAGRVDALGEREAGAALLDTFARLRPSTAGRLTIEHRVSWGSEALIGGEKYVLGPGQVTKFAKSLATPVGPLHWAGEHHKSHDVGIEAALQSGERAALEVIGAAMKA